MKSSSNADPQFTNIRRVIRKANTDSTITGLSKIARFKNKSNPVTLEVADKTSKAKTKGSKCSKPLPFAKPARAMPPLTDKERFSELFDRVINGYTEDRLAALLAIRKEAKSGIAAELQAKVIARDHSICCLCGYRIPESEITVTYDKTTKDGGTATADNLRAACFYCDAEKDEFTIAFALLHYKEKFERKEGEL